MPDTVYIVTTGSYSDYHIVRVYLNKQEARTYVDRYNATSERYRGELDIEEWPVGCAEPYDGYAWQATWMHAKVWTDAEYPPGNARIPGHYRLVPGDNFETTRFWHSGSPLSKAEIVDYNDGIEKYTEPHIEWAKVTARGTSKEHCEKAVQDRAAQIKALHAGIA